MRNESQNELNLKTAEDVRVAVQEKNLEGLLDCFDDKCEIELFGLKLAGKDGVKKWFKWTYSHMDKIGFENTKTIIDGNVLFEEYILNGVIHTGKKVKSRQMRSLIFEDGKIKTFRLYMDRLQFADSIAEDFASKLIISKFTQRSVREMLQ
jgi:ketosteroid isomerase-like protein